MLDPMDFGALYQQQLAQRRAEGKNPFEKPAAGEVN
jgi:preprotein translocase subunit SecB